MANSGVFRYLQDSAGNDLNALAKTTTFQSETFDAKDYDKYGLLVDTNTLSGTDTTVTATVQISPDGGTTWLAAPTGAENTGAQATFLISAGGATEEMEMWPNWFPEIGKGSLDPKYRINFDMTNVTSWTTNVWLVMRNFSR